MTNFRSALCAVVLVALVTAGCGASQAAQPDSSTVPPRTLASEMILRSVTSHTKLAKTDVEPLSDQLVPKTVSHAAAYNALTRSAWLASSHSVFTITGAKGVNLLTGVNLFKDADSAQTLFHMGVTLKDSATPTVSEAVPAGSLPGTMYQCAVQKGYQACKIGWRQGSVIGIAMIVGKGDTVPTRKSAAKIAPLLHAAQMQISERITVVTGDAPGS